MINQSYVEKSFFSQVKTLYFFLSAKMILSAKEVVSVSETNYANEMVQRTDSSGDLIYVKESFTATRRKESVVRPLSRVEPRKQSNRVNCTRQRKRESG